MENLVLVYGMGISAKAAAAMASRLGFTVALYDDVKDAADGFYGCIDRRGLPIDRVLDGAALVILSPSVPLDAPLVSLARKKGVDVIGETEFAYRYSKSDVIAVTGTNGKTTVTMMISKLLSDCGIGNHALGNIGVPFSEKALDMTPDEVAVLEVSSFQLETIDLFRPKIALCLNVTPDHLERHKSFGNYIRTKRSIFDNMTSDDFAVLNADDDIVAGFADSVCANTFYFSAEKEVRGVFAENGAVYFKENRRKKICDVRALGDKSPHNLLNALACLCVSEILNLPDDAAIRSLASFKPPRHRLELVGKVGGASVYNDSKSTNTDSTVKACRAMFGSVCLIVGGYDKGLDCRELFASLPKNVKTAVCFGANRKKLISAAEGADIAVLEAESLDEAVEKSLSSDAANVLFSPATSSFDMFSGFEERGEAFVRIVKEKICAQNKK